MVIEVGIHSGVSVLCHKKTDTRLYTIYFKKLQPEKPTVYLRSITPEFSGACEDWESRNRINAGKMSFICESGHGHLENMLIRVSYCVLKGGLALCTVWLKVAQLRRHEVGNCANGLQRCLQTFYSTRLCMVRLRPNVYVMRTWKLDLFALSVCCP